MAVVPHLMTLADLSAPQIRRAVSHAYHLKQLSTPWLAPQQGSGKQPRLRMPSQSLFNKSIALLFSKRSTRTRVAAETAALLLGGRTLFLGKDDIQLGVNESPRDTARVIGGMCQGIFARVGDHSEIEVRGTSRVLNLRIYILTLAISYSGTRKVFTCASPECIVFPLASYPSSRRPSHTPRACTPLWAFHHLTWTHNKESNRNAPKTSAVNNCICWRLCQRVARYVSDLPAIGPQSTRRDTTKTCIPSAYTRLGPRQGAQMR